MVSQNSKTNREMIEEIYTVLLGVPGTDERGVVGDIRSLSEQVRGISRAVQTNTTWRRTLVWLMGVLITAVIIVATIVLTH